MNELLTGARGLWRLPGFLRRPPISVVEARAILRRRQERRADDLLDLVRRTIYANPRSPYQPLLRHAGVAYADLASLVGREGVEGALRVLLREGVYLTADEFKGRRPVVRGSTTLRLSPAHLRNPTTWWHLTSQTSGSRGERVSVSMDLAVLRDRMTNDLLALAAWGPHDWVFGFWKVPGGDALSTLVHLAGLGMPPARWFSQVAPDAPGLAARYRWSERLVRWIAAGAGVRLPRPEYVSLGDPSPIVRWMAEALGAGRTPHLQTFASSAVRVCRAALDSSIDLTGARFMVGGEPVTEARVDVIRRAGAEVRSRYLAAEAGLLGLGCLAARVPDELHVCDDLNAVVPGEGAGLPPECLLVTSLRPTAPMILLNVSLGDRGVLGPRPCDCPLEALGWKTHLHTLRSFEKLTAGGMSFAHTELIRVLETTLPTLFGGGPADYQLVEDGGSPGEPRVRLLVHPRLGPLDPGRVAQAFLDAVGEPAGAGRVMGLAWREGSVLRVERRAPLVTASGKILHLHESIAPEAPLSGA